MSKLFSRAPFNLIYPILTDHMHTITIYMAIRIVDKFINVSFPRGCHQRETPNFTITLLRSLVSGPDYTSYWNRKLRIFIHVRHRI
jgi:hypothetical protein